MGAKVRRKAKGKEYVGKEMGNAGRGYEESDLLGKGFMWLNFNIADFGIRA